MSLTVSLLAAALLGDFTAGVGSGKVMISDTEVLGPSSLGGRDTALSSTMLLAPLPNADAPILELMKVPLLDPEADGKRKFKDKTSGSRNC